MQLTFLERKVSQRTLRRAARLSANESFPPAPGFSRVSGCPLASALNSRRVVARDNSRPWQLAIARAHREASARPRPSAWALNSRPWQLAIARAHRTASARARPSAWALNSPPGSSLSLVLIERPAHVRGPVPGLSNRAPGSSLSLVLIKPPTHVRGPVPGLSNRAPGSSLSLVLIEPPAHVRGPVPGLSIRAPWQLAIARAHRTASARPRGLHPRQFAARGRAGQFAPWSGELRSRLCKPPAHVRAGGCAWNFLRPRTLYFTGPALDFCEFSLNFPCIFGKIGIRKQPLSQIF